MSRIAAGAAALALSACGAEPDTLAPEHPLDACERRLVVDPRLGRAISGAEDLALSTDGATLYVSAYDRLALEAAAKTGGDAPEGGVFAVALDALLAGDVIGQPVLPLDALPGGLRPHGVDVDGERLLAVVRPIGDGAVMGGLVEMSLSGGQARRIDGPWCAANDVAFTPEGAAVTLDRETCPGRGLLETVFGLPTGRVLGLDAEEIASGLAFANGVAALPGGRLAVAETRARRVRLLPGGEAFALPGAPDNLTVDAQGGLVIAVQPDLIAFARYRYGRAEAAPSRIVALDPDGGAVSMLFDDPDGAVFSGATVGVAAGGALIVGSVRERGLLVCRREAQ